MIDWRGMSMAAKKSQDEFLEAMVAPSLSKKGVVGHLVLCVLLVNTVGISHPVFVWPSVVYLTCVTVFVLIEKTRMVALYVFAASISLYGLVWLFWAISEVVPLFDRPE